MIEISKTLGITSMLDKFEKVFECGTRIRVIRESVAYHKTAFASALVMLPREKLVLWRRHMCIELIR
jgi:hypothetical protein